MKFNVLHETCRSCNGSGLTQGLYDFENCPWCKGDGVTPMRHIVGVAIMKNDIMYALPAPNRHHNIMQMFPDDLCPILPDEQGFIDSNGDWVEREEARGIAEACYQLTERAINSTDLFSEDVW